MMHFFAAALLTAALLPQFGALCAELHGGVRHGHDRRCKTALHAREDIAAFVAQYMKEGNPHEHCI